jgi:hypothetical protein
MSTRVVVDPITRIEGHLRIEAQLDGDKIANAYSAGTMVRGIEIILQGRDPRDAWDVLYRGKGRNKKHLCQRIYYLRLCLPELPQKQGHGMDNSTRKGYAHKSQKKLSKISY